MEHITCYSHQSQLAKAAMLANLTNLLGLAAILGDVNGDSALFDDIEIVTLIPLLNDDLCICM